MFYGKIIDGLLKIAPNKLLGLSQEEMAEHGFYPVEEKLRPEMDGKSYAVAKYVQDGTTIKQEWDIHPDTNPLSSDEVFRLMIRKQVNSLDIDDATASRMVDYYPTLSDFASGALIAAKTVINHNGTLKRATVDLWNQDTNRPDNAPTLWEDISYKDGIRVAPETFTATNAAAMDELMWFGEHIYRSKMAGNVYTPEQYAAGWELLT